MMTDSRIARIQSHNLLIGRKSKLKLRLKYPIFTQRRAWQDQTSITNTRGKFSEENPTLSSPICPRWETPDPDPDRLIPEDAFSDPPTDALNDNSSSGMFQKHRPLRISEPTPVCHSPDSVLKCPVEVLSDLNEAEDFRQNLIEEQKAIEADLAMQKLSPTVITLMKVSKSVADELKTGVDVIRPVIVEATRMESMIQSPRSPTSRKRTRESAQDPKGKKKQHSDEEMVEAASQKWLHEQK
ncbi:hypothetical protein LINGRAPRIM_LOCUS2799 [Linum grandiflorum]